MRVGLIGAGRQGRKRARALTDFGDKLVAVADIDLRAAKALAEIYKCRALNDWHDIISQQRIDAIVVCTPNHLHVPISITAIKSGKHVLCEKPLARNPREAEEILKVVRESDVKLKCGFTLRYHPGIRQVKNWLDQGVLGKILYLRCRHGICGRVGYEKEWRAKAEIAGGGELMDQGVHVLDLFRWFAGEFEQVIGYTATMFWNIAVEDNAFALLRNRRGQIASLHVSWTEWKNIFSFEVFGDKGYAKVEGLGGSYGVEKAFLGIKDFSAPFTEKIMEFRGEDPSLYEEWKDFSSAIKEGRKPLGNAYDGWAAVNLAYMIYESSKIGRAIDLAWSTAQDNTKIRASGE